MVDEIPKRDKGAVSIGVSEANNKDQAHGDDLPVREGAAQTDDSH
jgi:hypothetical protein